MLAAAWSTMFVYTRPFFIAILSLLTGRRMGPAVKYGTILRCKISFFRIAGTLALWILAIPCGPVHRDVFRGFRQEQATQHTDNFESRHKSRQFRQRALFSFVETSQPMCPDLRKQASHPNRPIILPP